MQYNEQAELFRPDCCFSSETGVNGVFPELESRTLPKSQAEGLLVGVVNKHIYAGPFYQKSFALCSPYRPGRHTAS